MGYRSLADCVRDLESTGQLIVIDHEVDPHLEVAAIQRAGLPCGRPGLVFPSGQRDGVPRARQPVRDARPGEIPVPRHARVGPPPGRAEGQPWRIRQEPVAIPKRAGHVLAAAPPSCEDRPDPGPPNLDRSAAADPLLADGRRAVHHPTPGLHGRSRPARAGPVQPGDVPGPARRQRVRAGPGGRTSLPDPPGHRRASCRGDPSRRIAARERLRRRPARHDDRRGHAAARGIARAGVRRRPGGPGCPTGRTR